MKAVGILVSVTILSIFMPGVQAAEPRSKVQWHADFSAARHVVKEVQRPLLVLFTMDNCLYCTKIRQLTYQHEKVVSTISRSFVATVVNATKHPQLADHYGVRIFPTTVIISPDGRVLDSMAGYIESGEMQNRLAKADQRMRVALKK